MDIVRRSGPIALPSQGEVIVNARPNLCPFGCADTQLDDHGYCHHLVGFTDGTKDGDSTIFERTRKVGGRWVTGEMDEEKLEDGSVQEYSVWRKLLPTDVVVHLNNGRTGKHFTGTQWSRVYRPRKGERPQFKPSQRNMASNPEMAQLQGVVYQQQEQIKQLAEQNKKLLKQFGVTEEDLVEDLEPAGS